MRTLSVTEQIVCDVRCEAGRRRSLVTVFSFTVGGSGWTISVTLTAAGPPATIYVGVGIGTPAAATATAAASGALLANGSVATPAGTTPQLSGTVGPGNYCVTVFDVGNETSQVTYAVTVQHPQAGRPLFSERFCSGRQHLRHAEGLGQVAGHAEIHRFDRARLGGEPGDDDHRQVRLVALRFADDREAVHAGHLQVRDQEIVRIEPHPLQCRSSVGGDVDVVFGERERLREEVADARLVVHDEDAGTRGAPGGGRGPPRGGPGGCRPAGRCGFGGGPRGAGREGGNSRGLEPAE